MAGRLGAPRVGRERDAEPAQAAGVVALEEHPEIVTERLPTYAPEVNPDELVWSWTKYGRLSNLAAQNTDWLFDHVIEALYYLRQHPDHLASFIAHSQLPLRL